MPDFIMHVSRGVFLKTCGLAVMGHAVVPPLLHASAPAAAESPMAGGDIFIGQILTVPYNFAPQGFALCQGQLLPISQNTALFALLGTTYGGNGISNFGLPDLRGSVPMHAGQGPGLTDRVMGEIGGVETYTLQTTQIPAHTHTISTGTLTATARCKNGAGTSSTPVGAVPAVEDPHWAPIYGSGAADTNVQTGGLVVGGTAPASTAGVSLPHNNIAPSLVVNYVIALQGVFPPHS